MSEQLAEHPLDQWEATFADGLTAVSWRDAPEPWLAGHVHVVRGLPDQPEPVPTGRLDFHQVIVPLTPFRVTERVVGGAPYVDVAWAPGEVFVLSHNLALADVHTTWSETSREGFGIVNLLLSPAQVAAACRAAGLDYAATEFLDRTPVGDPFLDTAVRQLGAELEAGAPGGRLYAEQLMQAVAVHLLRHYTAAESRTRAYRGGLPAERLRRVEAYVRAHLDEEIRLADLAEEAGYSEYHFCRAFKEETGETPYGYVIRLRMEEAKRLLREMERSVLHVALAVGYSSPSHFAQVFKRHTGGPPSAYRRDRR